MDFQTAIVIQLEPKRASVQPQIKQSLRHRRLQQLHCRIKTRVDIDGKMLSGSARANPVIQVAVKAVAASSNTIHPVAQTPFDADVTAVLKGLKDFAPKPLPARFRELQANNGRIEIVNARLKQGDTIGIASGTLGLTDAEQALVQVRRAYWSSNVSLYAALGGDTVADTAPDPAAARSESTPGR